MFGKVFERIKKGLSALKDKLAYMAVVVGPAVFSTSEFSDLMKMLMDLLPVLIFISIVSAILTAIGTGIWRPRRR